MESNVNKILERAQMQANLRKEYRRGEIYYIARTDNSECGSEQRAGRPAIIISSDSGNRTSDNVTVAYLTTQPKAELKTHVFINSARKVSIALCECVNTISKERIGEYYGRATQEEMEKIDGALKIALELKGQQEAENREQAAENRQRERTEKPGGAELDKARKEAAFYKMMYEETLEKMKRLALGGYVSYAE